MSITLSSNVACPHRGGRLATDARGRLYAVWYTEAAGDRPDLLRAVADDGRRFARPHRVNVASGSAPDHPRLAVNAAGRGVVVWEDSTAVVAGSCYALSSKAIRAWAPDVAVAREGFVVAWYEEQFPATRTIVRSVSVKEVEGR